MHKRNGNDTNPAPHTLHPPTKKMKKLFPTIVTTRRIASPTEQFDAAEIQALAESALQLGGFIQPPVLKRDGENYTIVSGHKKALVTVADLRAAS